MVGVHAKRECELERASIIISFALSHAEVPSGRQERVGKIQNEQEQAGDHPKANSR